MDSQIKHTLSAIGKIAAIGYVVWMFFPLPAFSMAAEAEELFPKLGLFVSLMFCSSVLCCVLVFVSLEDLFHSRKTLKSWMVTLVFVALTFFPYALFKSMVQDQVFERKLSKDELASIKRTYGRIVVHYEGQKTIVRCRRY
ncbi:MAG: hypothetical protein WA117_02585 [Verrucomicrobiia bacterium]